MKSTESSKSPGRRLVLIAAAGLVGAVAVALFLANRTGDHRQTERGTGGPNSPANMGQGSGAPFSAAANRRRPAGSGAANPSSDEAIIAKKVMPSNWLRLDTETVRTGRLYSGADLTTDYIHATAGFSYTLPLDGCFQMDLLAGVCLWNIDVEFEKDNYTANLDAQGVQVGLTFKF